MHIYSISVSNHTYGINYVKECLSSYSDSVLVSLDSDHAKCQLEVDYPLFITQTRKQTKNTNIKNKIDKSCTGTSAKVTRSDFHRTDTDVRPSRLLAIGWAKK